MIDGLITWLDRQNIAYRVFDKEVVEVEGFGKLFSADLSGVSSIFRSEGDSLSFNLMENPDVLMEEGIFHVAFPFGKNWYYYDLREDFRFNILRYIGHPKPCRHDIPFVNLGVHTPYELLNASGSLEEWCRKARWLGHTALGICDRNTMAATLGFQKACAAAGLKHVFGYSLTMRMDETDVELKIYALSQEGLHNLLCVQRAVMVDSGTNTLGYTELLKHSAGCALVFDTRSAYWITEHLRHVGRLRQEFETVYYQVDGTEFKADRIDRQRLEAMRHYFRNCYDPSTGSFLVEPILISDCHYPDREDAGEKAVLNRIATGAAHEQSDDQYFKSVDEHYDTLSPLFSDTWDFDGLMRRMCAATVSLAGKAGAMFETGRMFMPEYMMRPQEKLRYGDRRKMFLRLLDEGLQEKIRQEDHGRYRQRLEEEVYIIESTDNVDYFLIQWDMVREARGRGIATGIGRGSAGGSLVSYLLGITSVDPLKYDLLFSRFLVPERCGLNWKEDVTVLAPDMEIEKGKRYVEISTDGRARYRLHPDARLRVVRDGRERTVYADELGAGDDILFDRRDLLWNLRELQVGGHI